MKCHTDQLITAADDLLIAETAGHGQGQIILLRLVHQMQNLIEEIADFRRLTIETLWKKHSELCSIHLQATANHSRVYALRP